MDKKQIYSRQQANEFMTRMSNAEQFDGYCQLEFTKAERWARSIAADKEAEEDYYARRGYGQHNYTIEAKEEMREKYGNE